MARSSNAEKFLQLRESFPFFVFEKQSYALTPAGLEVAYTFNLADKYQFHPSFFIPRKSCFLPDKEIADILPALVFNIGLIELISYWKLACSPRVVIRPANLSPEQLSWWKDLYFHGLGEFFYLNSIDTTLDTFFTPEVASDQKYFLVATPLDSSVLIPVGGGKDSAVTLGLLGRLHGSLPLMMNPSEASLASSAAAGFAPGDPVVIRRNLDPLMIELNRQGFLNGHTPFSALLAFYSVLAAVLTGRKYIALSNESSANEPTIPGTAINHQYSKSVRFEGLFREYSRQYLHPGVEYFSFLRPLQELQIAGLFAGMPAYRNVFRSCNAGSKTGVWCGKCSKCLFTRIILGPYLSANELTAVFGRELLDDPDLAGYFDQLAGIAPDKPFECIGTVEEVNMALQYMVACHPPGRPLPLLLGRYREGRDIPSFGKARLWETHGGFENHFIPGKFLDILKMRLKEANI